MKEGSYQPFTEAQQDRGKTEKEPPHVNSSENAVSSEETGKMKEHSQKVMKMQIFTNDYLLRF